MTTGTIQPLPYIVELKSRVSAWQDPQTQKEYVLEPSNPMVPNFGIERDFNGYFYLSENLVSYCDLRSGMIYRIKKGNNSLNSKCYKEFYELGAAEESFRIDIPIHREEIQVDGITWEYLKLQSPGGDYGFNFNDDVFEWPELINGEKPNPSINDELRDSVRDYFKNFIDQSLELVKKAKQVADANACGMPLGIVQTSNRFKDKVGYFWSDLDHNEWSMSKDQLETASMDTLYATFFFAKICGVLDDLRVNELITYARLKWSTI